MGRIPYKDAWDYQKKRHAELVEAKKHNRDLPLDSPERLVLPHRFLFCEHPPVYTLGKGGDAQNLLLNQAELAQKGIEFYHINRGGDITYHGPGQIVGYPIFDLDDFFNDVHRYVRSIEEAIIRALAEFNIKAGRIEGLSGVWLQAEGFLPKRKICALGVHLSRWVTMHGFALNANTDLAFFNNIIPCGIVDTDKTVTSMAFELQQTVDLAQTKVAIIRHFSQIFDFDYEYINKNI